MNEQTRQTALWAIREMIKQRQDEQESLDQWVMEYPDDPHFDAMYRAGAEIITNLTLALEDLAEQPEMTLEELVDLEIYEGRYFILDSNGNVTQEPETYGLTILTKQGARFPNGQYEVLPNFIECPECNSPAIFYGQEPPECIFPQNHQRLERVPYTKSTYVNVWGGTS